MAIDRKRAQERLLDAERLATMGQLAGFIAHELNTPLTTISLLTSAASKRVTDPVALGKLEKIDTERRRAARIVHGLVRLARSPPSRGAEPRSQSSSLEGRRHEDSRRR